MKRLILAILFLALQGCSSGGAGQDGGVDDADGVDAEDGADEFNGTDGSNIVGILDTGRDELLGIAVDEGEGKIYFAHKGHQTIERVNANGTCREVLVSNIVVPEGLAIDTVNGLMYWTLVGEGYSHLVRAKMDGTEVTTLSTELGPQPNDIEIYVCP